MPKGPQGQKRPADVIGNAVHIMRIATGEITESDSNSSEKNSHAVKAGKLGGAKGGRARAESLTKKERSESASRAAKARWHKS
jgi:hypothetical protein